MDRVLLNKILDCDITLSNVFMRTCKRFNRYIRENKTLMDVLVKHYQPVIIKELHFEMNRLFDINSPLKKIENILINDKHKVKKAKVSEIILLENNGFVLKSFTLKKVDKLFNAKINVVRETKRLCDVYSQSVGYRLLEDKNEKILTELIKNFTLLVDTIVMNNHAKYIDQTRFPANTYLKYFILMIAVLYVRYTFMK